MMGKDFDNRHAYWEIKDFAFNSIVYMIVGMHTCDYFFPF